MTGYKWSVIGAGPAGIAAVGSLLDHGVAGHEILWVDPQFTVGDFGSRWKNIPSNTKVSLFLKFLYASHAFSYALCDQNFELNQTPGEQTCLLALMAEPLQWVTHQLQTKVSTKKDFVKSICPSSLRGDDSLSYEWSLNLSSESIHVNNIILAIGAEPKTLDIPSCPIIPLQDAMDCYAIKKHLTSQDVIAVFGSSHSAVLALKNLVNGSPKKIINFYRSPLIYAVYTEEGIVNDDTGLKGSAAEWARENLHEILPPNLIRFESNDDLIQTYLPECTKVVFAIGFERRPIVIEGMDSIQYNPKTGVIAPGLYGVGIAFPEAKTNLLGATDYSVGLWKFMSYLQRVMPLWMEGAQVRESSRVNKDICRLDDFF